MNEFISVLLFDKNQLLFKLAYVSTAMLRYFSGYRVMPTKWFVFNSGCTRLVYIYHLSCPDFLRPIIIRWNIPYFVNLLAIEISKGPEGPLIEVSCFC